METYVGSTGNAFHVLPSIPTLYSSGITAGALENVSLRGDADRHRGEFLLLSRVFKQRRSATGAPTTQRILCAERTPVAAKRLHPSVTAIGVSENARQSARAATYIGSARNIPHTPPSADPAETASSTVAGLAPAAELITRGEMP